MRYLSIHTQFLKDIDGKNIETWKYMKNREHSLWMFMVWNFHNMSARHYHNYTPLIPLASSLTLYFSCVGWLVRFCSIMDKVCNAFLASAAFAPRSNCCKAVSASPRTVRASPFLGLRRRWRSQAVKTWRKTIGKQHVIVIWWIKKRTKNLSPLMSSHVNILKHLFNKKMPSKSRSLMPSFSLATFGAPCLQLTSQSCAIVFHGTWHQFGY